MKHWRIEENNNRATLYIDVAEQSANTLSQEVMRELDELLVQIEKKPYEGLIVASAKRSGFIAGADIKEFETITDVKKATELARAGQRTLDRLARLPYPTVVLINGFCLGGGFELALACDYLIACDEPNTRIGLPEVKLGIHPGFAGTVRLPPRIGYLPALDMILVGRIIDARRAKKLGVVDDAVPRRHLMSAAHFFIDRKPTKKSMTWQQKLAGLPVARTALASMARRQLKQKHVRPEHYPAPYRIVELWQKNANQAREAQSLGELLVGETSKNLVYVFMLSERLKREGRAQKHGVQNVHVIGAGVMGADIAIWAAYKGFQVSLHDVSEKALAQAMKRAHKFFNKKLKASGGMQAALDRLLPDSKGGSVRRADIVIEAASENLQLKRELLAKAEQETGGRTILATNTSSIPLEEIAEGLEDRSRLVGLHFFNPVAQMQLVEIVHGEQSAAEMIRRTKSFAVALDRLPLGVKSSPGFLVNRVLMPYLVEAVNLVEEGVTISAIDAAAMAFGMPIGPIELADTVGLDICLAVAQELAEPLGIAVPEPLKKMVQAGHLGKKTGKGFYRYDKSGQPRRTPLPGRGGKNTIADRLILRLLNEAMRCLRSGIVQAAEDVDAGLVYGAGFAPYLGGPMHYVQKIGAHDVSHSLYRLAAEYGDRFTPDSGWEQADLLARQIPAT